MTIREHDLVVLTADIPAEGLEQGVEDFLDRRVEEARNVVADLEVHAGREAHR